MSYFFNHHRGETIAETIIALSILAIGITFSATLLATSLGNISSSKNRVIAVNIAREGLESVRNIRDTNWLRFSGNQRDCWNHLPQSLPDECTEGAPLITVGTFIVYKDAGRRFRLRPFETLGDFNNSQLYQMDIDISRDTDSDGNFLNDPDIYNHLLTADRTAVGGGDDPLGFENARLAFFRRTIEIDYLSNADIPLEVPEGLTPAYNRMTVISRVEWTQNGRELEVELKTHLTDYFGRDNLES